MRAKFCDGFFYLRLYVRRLQFLSNLYEIYKATKQQNKVLFASTFWFVDHIKIYTIYMDKNILIKFEWYDLVLWTQFYVLKVVQGDYISLFVVIFSFTGN